MSEFFMNYDTIKPIETFNEKLEYIRSQNTFTKIPNILINVNLEKKYGLNAILPYVYYLIDRNCNIDNMSYIIPQEVLNTLNYNLRRNKPLAFYTILNSLLCLQKSNYIEINMDLGELHRAGYNTFIPINIISSHFYKDSNFTKIHHSNIDKILGIKDDVKIENLIYTYMYVCSSIIVRPKESNGKEVMYNPETKPEYFNRNIRLAAKETGIAKTSLYKYLEILTENKLLVKRIISVKQPAIYVLNTPGWEQELNWAMHKISKFGYEETEK